MEIFSPLNYSEKFHDLHLPPAMGYTVIEPRHTPPRLQFNPIFPSMSGQAKDHVCLHELSLQKYPGAEFFLSLLGGPFLSSSQKGTKSLKTFCHFSNFQQNFLSF